MKVASDKIRSVFQSQLESHEKEYRKFHRLFKLWDSHKLNYLKPNTCVIQAYFGYYGAIEIHDVLGYRSIYSYLPYSTDYYSHIEFVTKTTKVIAWTDYENIEPLNRNQHLYCFGYSFEQLGKPVVEKEHYREFQSVFEQEKPYTKIMATEGLKNWNGKIRFSICIEKEKVESFLNALRVIIDKKI